MIWTRVTREEAEKFTAAVTVCAIVWIKINHDNYYYDDKITADNHSFIYQIHWNITINAIISVKSWKVRQIKIF
jgi:hypothetical protein